MDESNLAACLRSNMAREFAEYYGRKDFEYLDEIVAAWMDDQKNSIWRYKDIEAFSGICLTEKTSILDMSSGCGTFVFYGLLSGWDVWGIDPEDWKHQFNRAKCDIFGYPTEWKSRFIKGVGEELPFPDEHFDFVSSYQTIEHVQNVERCLYEMIRVLKPGGMLFLNAPDYLSTFEAHYGLPWLPMMPRSLARIYLGLLRRPQKGLSTLNYVTTQNVSQKLYNNPHVEEIFEQTKIRFIQEFEKRFFTSNQLLYDGAYFLFKVYRNSKVVFRREFPIALAVVKRK